MNLARRQDGWEQRRGLSSVTLDKVNILLEEEKMDLKDHHESHFL